MERLLRIIDISDPSNPLEVGTFDIPGRAWDVHVSNGYAYLSDARDQGGQHLGGALYVVDVSNPSNPVGVDSVETPDWARGLHVFGNYAYVAAYTSLVILDVTDPSNLVEVASLDMERPEVGDVYVSNGWAYVTCGAEGLRIVDDPSNPLRAGKVTTLGAYGVCVSDGFVYVADKDYGVEILKEKEGVAPYVPDLISPDDSSYINDNTPTLTWSCGTGKFTRSTSVTYCLQIAMDASFDTATLEIDTCGLSDTVYTVTDTLTDATYYWHVEAVDQADNHSGYQDHPFMFTIDTQPPVFLNTTALSDTMSPTGPYPITSVITDVASGVDSASLHYRFEPDTTWYSQTMQHIAADTYKAEIPQLPDSGITVYYYLRAKDFATNVGFDPEGAVNETKEAGYYEIAWDARDHSGKKVPSGVYFYKIQAHTGLGTGDYIDTRKMILVR